MPNATIEQTPATILPGTTSAPAPALRAYRVTCARCGRDHRENAPEGITFTPANWERMNYRGTRNAPICDACLATRGNCSRCGVLSFNAYATGTGITAPRGVVHHCASCFQDYRNMGQIHSYGHKPELYFLNGDKRTTKARPGEKYFGIEIEAERKDYNVRAMVEKFTKYSFRAGLSFWATADSSLTDRANNRTTGAEFKTHPFTMAYMRGTMKPHAFLTALRKAGGTAYKSGRCGLHVHVSHPYFTSDTNAFHNRKKIRMFVSKCQRPVKVFACRHGKGDNYNAFEDIGQLRRTSYDSSHCTAVNTENGSRTVEFRMFRGTLDQARFTASIQFCDAVTDFCMLHGHAYIYRQTPAILWSDFVRFIRARAKWGKLYAQLVRQEIAQ